MHERYEPKSKRARKELVRQSASEQLGPDEYKEYEMKQMKGK